MKRADGIESMRWNIRLETMEWQIRGEAHGVFLVKDVDCLGVAARHCRQLIEEEDDDDDLTSAYRNITDPLTYSEHPQGLR